jgi:hypothetical protein
MSREIHPGDTLPARRSSPPDRTVWRLLGVRVVPPLLLQLTQLRGERGPALAQVAGWQPHIPGGVAMLSNGAADGPGRVPHSSKQQWSGSCAVQK